MGAIGCGTGVAADAPPDLRGGKPSISTSVVFASIDSRGSLIYLLLYVYLPHGVHSGRGLVPISGRPFKISMHGRGYYFGDDSGGITG